MFVGLFEKDVFAWMRKGKQCHAFRDERYCDGIWPCPSGR